MRDTAGGGSACAAEASSVASAQLGKAHQNRTTLHPTLHPDKTVCMCGTATSRGVAHLGRVCDKVRFTTCASGDPSATVSAA